MTERKRNVPKPKRGNTITIEIPSTIGVEIAMLFGIMVIILVILYSIVL